MEIEDKSTEELIISQMLRGERPENMPFEEFKIKRKAVGKFLKRKKRGNFIYISKEAAIGEDGKPIIKVYNPYKAKKDEHKP